MVFRVHEGLPFIDDCAGIESHDTYLPDIHFSGRAFVFTGDSSKCDRERLVEVVVSRGGVHHKNIRRDTSYLIVCAAGSPCWAFSCYGRKVEQALPHRKAGIPIVIVHENDFWDAIA